MHFMEKTKSNKNVQDAFKDVNFGDAKNPDENFYSELFYLPEADYRGEVPRNSLFNLETLKKIFDKFKETPDLIENPNVDFTEFIP